jgi:hypothetical protein
MNTMDLILLIGLIVLSIADLLAHQQSEARLDDAERDIVSMRVDWRNESHALAKIVDDMKRPTGRQRKLKADVPIKLVPTRAMPMPALHVGNGAPEMGETIRLVGTDRDDTKAPGDGGSAA